MLSVWFLQQLMILASFTARDFVLRPDLIKRLDTSLLFVFIPRG
ncbi:hypothetical protein SynBIOSU31_03048 [Synechococcus sp. BIOS-U3-1]|nr:hypothetical protein SynBIOSU31_03048 [Synechococcus sp. BIOS-U3-1]